MTTKLRSWWAKCHWTIPMLSTSCTHVRNDNGLRYDIISAWLWRTWQHASLCRLNTFLDNVDVGEYQVHGDIEAYSCKALLTFPDTIRLALNRVICLLYTWSTSPKRFGGSKALQWQWRQAVCSSVLVLMSNHFATVVRDCNPCPLASATLFEILKILSSQCDIITIRIKKHMMCCPS